uniref:Uncharacterized protein n=1 Tax=Rhizophora mucronata TaxID=61149 RepID=A0A2P2P7R6_RHIMU
MLGKHIPLRKTRSVTSCKRVLLLSW